MPRKILIAPDKFKGTLTAPEAAAAIAAGWARARPADHLEQLPVSDGGDGFGPLLGRLLGAAEKSVETVNAAQEPLRASWWWEPRTRTAIVESARSNGLALLPAGRYHPFTLDTFGVGLMLRDVTRYRPRQCLVGVGGSATNDGGFGLARALGWKFLDAAARPLASWIELERLARVVAPRRLLDLGQLTVAVDVRNPLLGARGASRVYGPQKGLRPVDMPKAEACLRRLAAVANDCASPSISPRRRGTGAAGGLAFGLACFAQARIESGFALFAAHAALAERIRSVDLVITGEGAIDETTLSMGKGVGGIAALCRRLHVPCLGLAGVVRVPAGAPHGFTELHALVPTVASTSDAMHHARVMLAKLAARVASASVA